MKFLIYFIILIPWFISSLLFPFNAEFYQTLNLPSFNPPGLVFAIVWPILYALIALSFYLILKKNEINKNYLFAYLLNYILNQSFSLVFFYLNNLTLTLYVTILLFISTIYLLIETKKANKISFYLLIPYQLWIVFATILYVTIYFLN